MTRKQSETFFALLLFVVLIVPVALADTEVGGLILEDTTWDAAGSPYIVISSIIVGANATLTIEPGVEVRFEAELNLLVGWSSFGPGTLMARGTEPSPIVFTSDEAAPAPGDWTRIGFLAQAADATFDGNGNYQSGCILEHVIIEHAGSGEYPAVNVDQSAPYLSYCEVRANLKCGIDIYGTPPLRIENCYVHDNQDGGMYFHSSGGNALTNNTISDNGSGGSRMGGIRFVSSGNNTLTGNTISGNTTDTGAYRGAGIYFSGGGGNTLTSNTISDNSGGDGAGIRFVSSGGNTLTDNTITGNSTNPNSASVGGIFFAAPGSNTLICNTISGNSGSRGGIFFDHSGGNTLTGNMISGNSAGYRGGGIDFYQSSGNMLTDNTITGNSADRGGGIGFYRWSGGGNMLTGNTIEENSAVGDGGAMYLRDSDYDRFAGNTIRFNHTTAGQTGGIFVTDGSEQLSLNGGVEAYNTICCNDGYEVYNDNAFSGDGRHDIDARNVFWGTDDPAVIQAEIYDFFDDADKAVVLWDPYVWNLPPGDLNGDGCVDHADLGILLADWGCTSGDCPGDCDFDGDTDHADLGLLLGHWGEGCP